MKEAFNVGFDLAPDDPELLAGKPFRSLNAWPKLTGFRETLLSYFDACAALGARLHRAFALDLGVEPDYFVDKFDRPMATLRLLRYPPASTNVGDRVGAGAHTDYGNLTLLATDDVGGLEVRTRAGAWIEAPALPGAFVVNIGDCLMRWTNDVYVSTPHRVVNRSARERYSIAFFFDPNPEAEVAVIRSCAGFWTPAAPRLSARSDGRRPKSARARSRGTLGSGWESSAMGISGWRRIRWRRDTGAMGPGCLCAAAGERVAEASPRGVERYKRAPAAWIALNRAERDRRRRGASAMERESAGERRKSGS